MTLNEALAAKTRGLTKEQIIAQLRAVAENNLRADIRTIERAGRKNREAIQKYRHSPIRPAVRRRLPQRTRPRGQNSISREILSPMPPRHL
jgi:hypothetical protein